MADTAALAADLLKAFHAGERMTLSEKDALTRDEAYDVQRQFMAGLGEVGGFKTAQKPGQVPIMAPIPRMLCINSGASVPVRDTLGVELEVGWLVTKPLPAPDASDFADRLRDCVLPLPVIELVDTRVTGPLSEDPMIRLADLQINKGLVLGAPLEDWDGSDFGPLRATMTAGTTELTGDAPSVPGGSALRTLEGFLAMVGDHCGGVGPGQVIITGSVHPLTWVPTGIRVEGMIEGLGSVWVTLDPI